MSTVSNHQPEIIDEFNHAEEAPRPRKARKPRPKPARSIRLVAPLTFGVGQVLITVGKLAADYTVECFDSPMGEAFKLVKCSPVADGQEDTYHVLLAEDGQRCDCKGFCRHGHCKHADGLLALRRVGKL